ncbi:MAG TPA: hypothetical protein VK629_07895, partial [Steroidobacteraceae bacterium]|nr:hypothetical protein [Steroidobacteraceae bacterium]
QRESARQWTFIRVTAGRTCRGIWHLTGNGLWWRLHLLMCDGNDDSWPTGRLYLRSLFVLCSTTFRKG